jgi:serpin B
MTTAAALAAAAATRRLTAGADKPAGDTPMAAGTPAFASDLYAKLATNKGNVFFSPFSISACLAMTAAGAKGETLAQMRKVLHLPEGNRFGELIKAVTAWPDPKKAAYELSTANAVWGQKGYPWRPEFIRTVRDGFGADVRDADFAANPESARKAINAWVEQQTREKIKELLEAGSITPLTRMVLANAVYFKGLWESPFEKDATRDAPFTLADGSKKTVPLMARTGNYAYDAADGYSRLRMPYAGGQASMVIVLPKKPDGLPEVEKKLGPELFTMPAARTEVKVLVPRFKVEKPYTLNDSLKELGMTDAFDDHKADFSGMVSHTPEGMPLYISTVAHKAFVDVNEEGTEAAAATGAVVAVKSLPPEPKVFRADHPFLFAIRHDATGAILFLGRYEMPA